MKVVSFFAVFCLLIGVASIGCAETVPQAELPVLILSAGQSPGIYVANALADRMKLPYDASDVAGLEVIKKGVGLIGMVEGEGVHVWKKSEVPEGTPYKTIIMVLGASLKGMGASGLSLDDEINRLKAIVEYCAQEGIFLVAMHIEGQVRRGRPGSDNEMIIDAVAPYADYLIVLTSSNEDGRFTKISEEKDIPLSIVERPTDIIPLLDALFSDECTDCDL